MNVEQPKQVSDFEWHIAPSGKMRVPAVIYADRALIAEMDDKVHEQIANVATLPGIVQAAYAMPDAHWGYGFPIGGGGGVEAAEGGAVSGGGARWAVEQGYGSETDLDRIEEHGCMVGAEPGQVSEQAKRRQRDEIGTLGSGNHYLELQEIVEIYDSTAAEG